MNQILSLLRSMKTMAVLMLVFAVSIGYATFVENDFGTMTAKAEIYNATWFEGLLSLLAINLLLNIFKYKMFTIKKAPIFIFHTAFLVILLGATITRYVGFEGSMHIREGESSSVMTSAEVYFSVDASKADAKVQSSQAVYLSKRGKNELTSSLELDGKKINVSLSEYIPDVMEQLVADESGKPTASLMVTDGSQGKPVALVEGESYDVGSYVLDFNSNETFDKPVIQIYVKNNELYMNHAMKLTYLKMDDRSQGDLNATQSELLETRTLYSTDLGSFVLKNFLPHASKKLVSNPNVRAKMAGYDALRFEVRVDDKMQEALVYGKKGEIGAKAEVTIEGITVNIAYGSKDIMLPFAIKLNDFQLDRYPGSMSPASYASEVELIDDEQNIHMPYRIFMNNILEHRGYRFFQASYDQDEQGTILSVNNDPGTLPSYIGYALLALGMFWSLFSKQHRFAQLAKKAKTASEQKLVPLLLGLAFSFGALPMHAAELDPAIKTIISFDKAHADKFGELIIQDSGGRMKPLDTLATEILAKINRSASLNVAEVELDANQIVLGMMVRPDAYRNFKIIRVGNKEINKIIGVDENAKYASFSQFFADPDNMRGYKLNERVDEATRKMPKNRNKFDKAILEIDERVNVSFMVYTGSLIKIWPIPNDAGNKWLDTIGALQTIQEAKAEELRAIAVEYFTAIDGAMQSGNWNGATQALSKITQFQKQYGSAVYPSENAIKAEVFYNHANIFETIYPFYLLMGFVLLILSFVKILKPSFNLAIFTKLTLYTLIVLFIAHTIGLALRWYISGHAPWSDGYESMIYIGWATVLAGFIFSKRSSITMASTGILTGLILFVAHLNWMNPQVTNLVPVLNSYWLSIHVSMITASYGFLGLGALLGFITILLFIFKNGANEKHISLSIKELNAINEMSLMVGLVLLTVGNFLGGVWANESWGRYWGWDPKETWALVTILVYAVVVHLRFIKSIYSEFNYSVITLLAFTSVIMTYFGVNYYLAGLHSYAKGDPVPIPDFVPISYAIIFVVIALAFRNRKLA